MTTLQSTADTDLDRSAQNDTPTVGEWLDTLDPARSATDALSLYQALLRHNRQPMSLELRRAQYDRFRPKLNSACRSLSERCQAQALPYSPDTLASARLLQRLQREQAQAMELLLTGSDRADITDIATALEGLARQAETAAHAYETLPAAVLLDAHHLYRQLEPYVLEAATSHDGPAEAVDRAARLYRYILLISIADLRSTRIAQLPAMLAFIAEAASFLVISSVPLRRSASPADYALQLDHGAPPAPLACLLPTRDPLWRHVDIQPLLYHLDEQITRNHPQAALSPGVEALQRVSLQRLKRTLIRSTHRRQPRRLVHREQRVLFGFRRISDYLMASQGGDVEAGPDTGVWIRVNETAMGCELVSLQCSVGQVQVGELVNLREVDDTLAPGQNGRVSVCLGVVRSLRSRRDGSLRIGVEFMASTLLPVVLRRSEQAACEPPATRHGRQRKPVTQESFIVTCKLGDNTLQTLVLPAYHELRKGEVVDATISQKSRPVRLQFCLQNNGLFSQFSICDP